MNGLDFLGASTEDEVPTTEASAAPTSWAPAATLAGGILGGLLWRRHPVLGVLDGAALAGNVARVVTKEIPVQRAAENLGAHLVATTASLALPAYPALAYMSGAIGSNLFLRRRSLVERIDDTVLGAAVAWEAAPSLEAVRSGSANIRRNHKGDSVLYVQGIVGDTAYAKRGFEADSKFGADTEDAVRKFQAAKNITQSGIVDQATMAAMDAVAGGTGGIIKIDFTKPAPSVAIVPVATVQPKPSAMEIARTASDIATYGVADGSKVATERPVWQIVAGGAAAILAGAAIVAAVSR